MIISFIFLIMSLGAYSLVQSFGQSSSRGINWEEMCNLADAIITEPCTDLVDPNNPYKLTREGEKVIACLGGGALAFITGNLELLSLGPAVGCGVSSSSPTLNSESRSLDESNTNPLNTLLKNFLGK